MFNTRNLPVKDAADTVGLALADGQLQRVAQGDQPPLAAERAHFADVVDIHDRIPMDSLELRQSQALFDQSQRLRCKEPMFGRNNPDQLPFSLKSQDVVRIQKEVFLPASSHNLLVPWRIGWFGCGSDFVETRDDLG